MSLVRAFISKRREIGSRHAIKLALEFVCSAIFRKFRVIYILLYSIPAQIDYYFNPSALKQSNIAPFVDNDRIRKEFIYRGFEVEDFEINKADFTKWLNEVNFTEEYSDAYGEAFTEKALEHYLSSKLLDLNESDVFVDVAAAASSPWYDLSEKRYQCKSFAVDLHLPRGKTDSRLIQCDATNMPFADGSISKIALHCAYEMFENEADTDFIKETNRVLSKKGKLVILPLYMDHFYYILSSPKANRSGIVYNKARRVWRDDKHRVRFSRHYSIEAFKERVVNYQDKLKLKIYYFTNEKEMGQSPGDVIYVKFAACFTKE
ncbi:methyltransferase domain-containing protein [Chloroflexota bacterium]